MVKAIFFPNFILKSIYTTLKYLNREFTTELKYMFGSVFLDNHKNVNKISIIIERADDFIHFDGFSVDEFLGLRNHMSVVFKRL